MSPAYQPPKSEAKYSPKLSEECKLLDFYIKGKIILVHVNVKTPQKQSWNNFSPTVYTGHSPEWYKTPDV